MSPKIGTPRTMRQLRRRAEAQLATQDPAPANGRLGKEESQRLLHELLVHQVELELQNEELRQTQLELEASRDRYFWLHDRAPVGYASLDPRGRLREVNLTLCGMLGTERSALLGQPFQASVDPREQKAFRANLLKCRTGGGRVSFDLRLLQPQDASCWNHVDAEELQEADGSKLLRLALSDISERIEAQAALEQLAELNGQITACVQEGIIVYGTNLHYRVWNPFMERLTGMPAEQVLGKHPAELFPLLRDVGQLANLDQALAGITSEAMEFPFQIPMTGRAGWARQTFTPFCDAQGTIIGVLSTVQDITERMRQETETRQLEEQLLNTSKMESLSSLAAGLAHDMNNVLGAIMAIASLQELRSPKGSPQKKAMGSIITACQRGVVMVKGLLDFSRENLALEQQVDLNTLVREEMALLEHSTLQRVRLILNLEEPLRPILGDPAALSHLLMNLCVNAGDAMPEGGTLSITTTNEGDDLVRLVLADTGCGMPKEVLDKALEPLFTTKPEGTGLGLAIVYGTTKAHHGSLELKSEPGQGTQAILHFPASLPQDEVPASPEEALPPSIQRTLHILLIDDDEQIREVLPPLLEALGHHSSAVACGEEGLAALEAGLRPDLVILDMNMPGLGGAGTLPRLRALLPEVPVLLTTGRAKEAAHALSLNQSNVAILVKPFSVQGLEREFWKLDRAGT